MKCIHLVRIIYLPKVLKEVLTQRFRHQPSQTLNKSISAWDKPFSDSLRIDRDNKLAPNFTEIEGIVNVAPIVM